MMDPNHGLILQDEHAVRVHHRCRSAQGWEPQYAVRHAQLRCLGLLNNYLERVKHHSAQLQKPVKEESDLARASISMFEGDL